MDTQKPTVFGISKTHGVVGDIHQYDRRYQAALEGIKTSELSERNKDLILGFDQINFLETKTKTLLF